MARCLDQLGAFLSVPANTWVPHVRASKFDAASAFVVMDNHRRDDWTPCGCRLL